ARGLRRPGRAAGCGKRLDRTRHDRRQALPHRICGERRMAEGGRLSDPAVETEVRQLLARMLGPGAARDGDMRRADLAQWDSLKHVEIVFALEDQFGVRFDESEFATLDSVPAIAAAVRKRHEA